ATVGVVSLAVWRFRKIALSEAFGEAAKPDTYAPIKRVTGAPIVWREMRKPFFGRRKGSFILYAVLTGVVLLGFVPSVLALFGFRRGGGPVGRGLYYYLMMGFSLIVFVRLAVLSAASITAEKEAGTWPILLATPLDDKEIVRGKAIAAFRRNVPLLLLLILLQVVLYLGIFLFAGMTFFSVFYVIIYVIGLAGTVVFVIGLGLYFGVRLKSTNAAVASTVGIYIGVELFGRRVFTTLLYSIFLAALYRQPGAGAVLMWVIPIAVTFAPTCVCLGVGLLAAQRARCRLRRSIF
ncbi:unnamed protein product, partial [marine sediment metagenome]